MTILCNYVRYGCCLPLQLSLSTPAMHYIIPMLQVSGIRFPQLPAAYLGPQQAYSRLGMNTISNKDPLIHSTTGAIEVREREGGYRLPFTSCSYSTYRPLFLSLALSYHMHMRFQTICILCCVCTTTIII